MCPTHQIARTFSEDRANAFAERLIKGLNEAALSLMTSIGHRAGLFDTLATLPPLLPAILPTKPDSTNAMCASG